MQQVLTAITVEAAVDPHQLCDEQVIADLETAFELRRRTDARIVALLQVANARQLTADLRGRTPRNWLIESQRLSAHEAGRLVKLARHLPFRPQLADAVTAGEISLDHAAPILTTVTKLAAEDQHLDEKILIEAARDLDVDAIRALCHKTLEAGCADEAAEARRERLYGSRYLKLSETFDGMVKLDAMLTPDQGAAIEAALTPLAHKLGPEDDRSAPQRHADALATLAQAALGFDNLLPAFNGEQPHVNAVIAYDPLLNALHPYADKPLADNSGITINGTQVTPQTARILACDANIIPVVMRGNSEVLDIGRATRTWPTPIRKALQLQDNGCGWPNCKMPLWACRIHHIKWWSFGGETSKTNGVHLCGFHHWLIHNKPWTIRRNHTGHIEVARTTISRS